MRRSVSLLKSTVRAPHLVIAALAISLTPAPAYADSVCQIAKLVAGDGAESDHFGDFVAISGITAMVGAPLHDHNGADSGSAYIFRNDGFGNWFEIGEITATDGEAGDFFGFRVAISGDTAVVSAYADDDKAENSGSAYIFREVDGEWMQIAKLTADDAAAEDRFGWSAAIAGDTAIVGAIFDDDNADNSGSAYIFQRDFGGPDNWGQVVKLTAGDGEEGDKFGISAAISGDTVIVGARDDDDLGDRSGSVYIFREIDGAWMPLGKLTASDGAALDRFGRSVGISGDTAIVGAWGNDDNGSRSGSAYILREIDGVWSEITKITDDDAAAEDRFGISVAMSGDIAVIGAYFDDGHAGSASVFVEIEGVWTQLEKLTAVDRAPEDRFGTSVAISGTTTIVGALLDDDNGSDSGSAYLFDLTDTDGDGVADDCDICPGGDDGVDMDGNGIPDHCDICDVADGDCFLANGTPGCNGQCGGEPCFNGSCCELICGSDPACCGIVWGEACATAAQELCNSFFWIEDVESYAPGSSLHGQGGWKGWDDDPAFTAFVSEDVNHTAVGSQSIKIEGSSDLVREFSGHSNGVWLFTAWQYIPSTFEKSITPSYFILLKTYNDGGPYEYSVQLNFDPSDGMIHCDCGESDSAQMPFNVDLWQKIEVLIALNSDWVQVYYNDSLIGEYPWTEGVFGGDGPCPPAGCIGAVDLFANGSSAVYYDDLSLEALAESFGACCDGTPCSHTLQTDCSFEFTPGVACDNHLCTHPNCVNADGDCFVGNASFGCNNQCDGVPCEVEKCCSKVCAFDLFCCEFVWDTACANIAQEVCTIPSHMTCDQALHQDLPVGGGTAVFTGNNQGAGSGVDDCEALEESEVWISFTIAETSNVELDYCDSPDFFDLAYLVLVDSCPCDGSFILGAGDDFFCIFENPYRIWNCLPAGTYYYPILSQPDSEGDYVITVTAAPPTMGECPDCPLTSCDAGSCTLTQSFSDADGETQVACATDDHTTENGFARCFDLADEGITGTITIESVRWGVGQMIPNPPNPDLMVPINVNVWDVPGCPASFAQATLVARETIMISSANEGEYITTNIVNLPTVAAGGRVVVEIEAPLDGTEVPLHGFRPMANSLGQCASSYLRSESCGIDDWTSTESIGFPFSHTYMEVLTSFDPCAAGCDDGDLCTVDTCDPEVGCLHTPNYDPASECCNPNTGGTIPVDDGNACTDDVCNSETGEVSHIDNFNPPTECCDPATGDIELIDDGNVCTDDACDPETGQVTHVDNFNPAIECCDPATGNITSLDDGNACTDDVCDPATGEVTHDENYDPATECCNPETGDITLIDDGNACTLDACDPATGQVFHIDIFDPATECCDPATGNITLLDDGNACTEDVCDAETGQVTHMPVVCPDGEVCDPETGKCASVCGPCPTDSSGDGNTGAADLASLLACWGPVVPGCECFDANGDGGIGPLDLATLLAAWGPCP